MANRIEPFSVIKLEDLKQKNRATKKEAGLAIKQITNIFPGFSQITYFWSR